MLLPCHLTSGASIPKASHRHRPCLSSRSYKPITSGRLGKKKKKKRSRKIKYKQDKIRKALCFSVQDSLPEQFDPSSAEAAMGLHPLRTSSTSPPLLSPQELPGLQKLLKNRLKNRGIPSAARPLLCTALNVPRRILKALEFHFHLTLKLQQDGPVLVHRGHAHLQQVRLVWSSLLPRHGGCRNPTLFS